MNEAKLCEDLKRDEGVVPHAYQDSNGYWTIGIGRLIDKRKGGKLSPEEMEFLLHNDIVAKQALLDKYLPWWRQMSEPRQRALCNMAFNLGVGPSPEDPEGKLLTFKNTLAAMERGDWAAVDAGLASSLWATKQVGRRAERIRKLFQEG